MTPTNLPDQRPRLEDPDWIPARFTEYDVAASARMRMDWPGATPGPDSADPPRWKADPEADALIDDSHIAYPPPDGVPLSTSTAHYAAGVHLHALLQSLIALRPHPDWFVAVNLAWYFEKAAVRSNRGPDVMVIPGTPDPALHRDSYMEWDEGYRRPTFVFELMSLGTFRDNLGPKKEIYRELEVPEYFLFDALGDFIDPPLQGFRLSRGKYVPIKPDRQGRLLSRELNCLVGRRRTMPTLFDRVTKREVLTESQRNAAERDAERSRADRLAEKLRELGIDPDTITGG